MSGLNECGSYVTVRNNVLGCMSVLNACAVVLVIVESMVTDDGRYNGGSFKK